MPLVPFSGKIKKSDPASVGLTNNELVDDEKTNAAFAGELDSAIANANSPKIRDTLIAERDRQKTAIPNAIATDIGRQATGQPTSSLVPFTGKLVQAQTEPSALQQFGTGIKRGAEEVMTNLAQAGLHVGASLGLLDEPTLNTTDQIVRDEAKVYEAKVGSSKAASAGNLLGTTAATLPLMFLPGGGASLAGRTAMNVAGGSLAAMSQPVSDTDYASGKTAQGVVGGVVGAVVPPVIGSAIRGAGAVAGKISDKFSSKISSNNQILRERPDDILSVPTQIRVPVPVNDAPAVFSRRQSIDVDPQLKQLFDAGKITPEQVSRAADFQKMGVRPTLGQITKDFDQRQFEQSMLGNAAEGMPIRQAADQSNREITQAAERLKTSMRGKTNTSYGTGKSVADAVLGNLDDAQTLIGKEYKTVIEKSSNKPVIKLGGTGDLIAEVSDDAYSKPFADSINNRLESMVKSGAIQEGNGGVRLLTAAQTEGVRKFVGKLGNDADPNIRRLRRDFIHSIDGDVDASVGVDVFKTARSMSADRFRDLDNPIIKALHNGEPVDKVTKNYVVNGHIDDIAGLKKILMTGTTEQIARGSQAWDNVRGEVVGSLMKKAINSIAPNAAGDAIFSGANLVKAVREIAPEKLNLLFNKQERDYLATLGRVAEYRIPPVGTTDSLGTSNALINYGQRVLLAMAKAKGLGKPAAWVAGLIKNSSEGAEKMANTARAQEAVNPMKTLKASADRPKTIPIGNDQQTTSSMLGRLGGLAVASDVGSLY